MHEKIVCFFHLVNALKITFSCFFHLNVWLTKKKRIFAIQFNPVGLVENLFECKLICFFQWTSLAFCLEMTVLKTKRNTQ